MKKIIFIIFFFSKVEAVTIYDHEIEKFISDLILITYPNNAITKFSIILNDQPNAFIDEKNIIYFTTGLLKYINSPEALIGVIAHEIGHIENYHISKRKKSIKNLQMINQLGNLTAIASSIITKNPDILIQTSVTNQLSIQNYYSSFSKDQEKEADLFAIDRLNILEISSKDLREFLEFLEKESFKKGLSKESFRFSTHPNYKERLNLISTFSNKNSNNIDPLINQNFKFIKSKLFGYTENSVNILENYLINEYAEYGKAIMLSNQGKLLESLKLINELIDDFPSYYYFLETKADILYNHSYTKEAEKFYKISLSKNLDNNYIKKRLFEIEYNKLIFENTETVNQIFLNYHKLIFIFTDNLIFYKKWKKILNSIKKNDWSMFVDAKIDLLNKDNNNAVEKIQKILTITNDNTLSKQCKIILNKIDNE